MTLQVFYAWIFLLLSFFFSPLHCPNISESLLAMIKRVYMLFRYKPRIIGGNEVRSLID